jgi:Bacterial antitoxin of type II TA system, VapB
MKTTVEIADGLLNEARQAAAREGTTVRALIEEGLRRVIKERRTQGRFRLRKASVGGQGLHPDLADGSWDKIRARIYDGHDE